MTCESENNTIQGRRLKKRKKEVAALVSSLVLLSSCPSPPPASHPRSVFPTYVSDLLVVLHRPVAGEVFLEGLANAFDVEVVR